MNGEPQSITAVDWLGPAPGGDSQAQIFRLEDGKFAIVKFAENPQGEMVLVNEFLCCQLGEALTVPVNRAVIVLVPEPVLAAAKRVNLPGNFTAGLACGMIRFPNSEGADIPMIAAQCSNKDELDHVMAFEQLVCRQDGPQRLMYFEKLGAQKSFVAYDYGMAFGGSPVWSAVSMTGAPAPVLPKQDPFSNANYANGDRQRDFINRLRNLEEANITTLFMRICPPRWGLTLEQLEAAAKFVAARAQALIEQFDGAYPYEELDLTPTA